MTEHDIGEIQRAIGRLEAKVESLCGQIVTLRGEHGEMRQIVQKNAKQMDIWRAFQVLGGWAVGIGIAAYAALGGKVGG